MFYYAQQVEGKLLLQKTINPQKSLTFRLKRCLYHDDTHIFEKSLQKKDFGGICWTDPDRSNPLFRHFW